MRLAVSGSKAHLDPSDVAVMDLERMVTYSGSDADETTQAERNSRLTAAHRSRIEAALADIEGVRVSVVLRTPEASPAEHAVRFAPANPSPAAGEDANGTAQHAINHGMEVPAAFADADEPAHGPVLDVIVVVPASHVQQQLATRMPLAADPLPASQSAALVDEVTCAIQDSIHERIAGLIASAPHTAILQSLEVQTEPVAIVDRAELSEPASLGWLSVRTAELDAGSWSSWAMFLGLGASLCWWLTDVIRWYGWPAGGEGSGSDRRSASSQTASAVAAERRDFPAEQTSEPLLSDCQVDEPYRGDSSPAGHSPTAMEELLDLNAADLRAAFEAFPVEVWATALRGCTTAVETQLLKSLPSAQAAVLRRQLRSARPVRLRDIEEAQAVVLSLWVAPSGV